MGLWMQAPHSADSPNPSWTSFFFSSCYSHFHCAAMNHITNPPYALCKVTSVASIYCICAVLYLTYNFLDLYYSTPVQLKAIVFVIPFPLFTATYLTYVPLVAKPEWHCWWLEDEMFELFIRCHKTYYWRDRDLLTLSTIIVKQKYKQSFGKIKHTKNRDAFNITLWTLSNKL